MLAERVERAATVPGEQHVPLVGSLVHRVDGRVDSVRANVAARVGEARHRVLADVAGAARNCAPPRIPAQVDVQLAAAALEPDEPDQVAAVTGDRVDVVPAAPDLPVERIRHPAGAVDRRMDAVREPLPAGAVEALRLRLDDS